MTKTTLYLILLCVIIFAGCTKTGGGGDPTPKDPCSGISFTFLMDVQPIINTSCTSCHGANSTNSGGPLTDYNLIFAKRTNIKYQIENGFMPKAGSITTAQKNTIICWINSGAPNN
jgi:hypothetical protein